MSAPGSGERVHLRAADPRCLVTAALVAALGGLLFGYDNIVISGAILSLSRYYGLDAAATGWAAGCALIGCIAGSLGAGIVVDRLGLRRALGLCALSFAASSSGILFAGSFTQFVAWRMLSGVGIGAASILSPMYIAEIAPARLRGRLVTLYQLGIVVGILTAVFMNMQIERLGDEAWNISTGWRWMFFAGLLPAVAFAAAIAMGVESPRWLAKAGRSERALRILAAIGGAEAATAELNAIEASLAAERGSLRELFGRLRRPLVIGVMLAVFQQWSGITPLFSYLPGIFRDAGAGTRSAFFQSVLVGLVNLVVTLAALLLVDRAGRKGLMLSGTLLQAIALGSVGWLYHVQGSGTAILVFVMAFVAGHAFGNGVACWVVISEIYPTRVRGRAMAIATTALWVVGYLGDQLFPLMRRHLGDDGTFWCLGAAAVLGLIGTLALVPETRGRSLEEIAGLWVGEAG